MGSTVVQFSARLPVPPPSSLEHLLSPWLMVPFPKPLLPVLVEFMDLALLTSKLLSLPGTSQPLPKRKMHSFSSTLVLTRKISLRRLRPSREPTQYLLPSAERTKPHYPLLTSHPLLPTISPPCKMLQLVEKMRDRDLVVTTIIAQGQKLEPFTNVKFPGFQKWLTIR